MSTSKAAIATKYKLFEKHDNTEYHSKNLPNPNVIRIEPLAPEHVHDILVDSLALWKYFVIA